MKKKKKSHRRKRQKYQYHGEVTMPWIAPAVGGINLLFCLVMMILSIRDKQFSLIIIFILFAMLGVFLILTVNWKITYDSNGFTYRNYLRQSKYYRYSEITKIYRDKTSCIYIGRKKITIDSMVAGDYLFLTHLELHTPLAEHLSAKDRKLFNGNIRSAGEIVFVYFLILAFLCTPMILMLVSHEISEDILIGSGIILFCWILIGIISNHILSHADKHPILVRMIVKEDAIIKK